LTVRNYSTLALFYEKRLFPEVLFHCFFRILTDSLLFCLIDFIALGGQASTQILQVLPTHFSLLNSIVPSFEGVIASTGQRATHEPQLKHLSLSTSISLGTETVTPRSRKALTIVSCSSSGISAKISPPLLFIWADNIAIGTLYWIIIWLAMGCETCSSENLIKILAKPFTVPIVQPHLQK
jgi:hypothetical protein